MTSFDPVGSESGVIEIQTEGYNEEQELIMSSTVTDFARKLYNLLQDPAYKSVICWEPEGDCFTVKDTNQFTKTILPREFNHSNFSSFVRQLNKYDFHKVKRQNSRDMHQPWTFKHSYFHADRPEDLQYVKRKAAAPARSEVPNALPSTSYQNVDPFRPWQASHAPYFDRNQSHAGEESQEDLLDNIGRLESAKDDLVARTQALERNYESMGLTLKDVETAVALRQVQMDSLMQQVQAAIPNANGHPQTAGASDNTPDASTHWHPRRTPMNLPPPFTRAPLNLERDHRLGTDTSTGHVLLSLDENVDPPVDSQFDQH